MPYDPTPRTNVREKLAYYLMGIAIGFVLLGLIVWGRSQMQRGGPTPNVVPTAPTGR